MANDLYNIIANHATILLPLESPPSARDWTFIYQSMSASVQRMLSPYESIGGGYCKFLTGISFRVSEPITAPFSAAIETGINYNDRLCITVEKYYDTSEQPDTPFIIIPAQLQHSR